MPLIRYANGDRAVQSPSSCDCGLPLPVMEMRLGRDAEIFVSPSGRRFNSLYLTDLLLDLQGTEHFQWHQTARHRIALQSCPQEDPA